MMAPASNNELKVIDVKTSPEEEIEALPDFIKDKIKSSLEYDNRFRLDPNAIDKAIDDSIPF